MSRLNCSKKRLVVTGIVVAIVLSGGDVEADFTFGEPENLGPVVNSESADGSPCISADGLELYFSTDHESGYGSDDLWLCTRTTTGDTWGPPQNLGPVVNSSIGEWYPAISADGLELYFELWDRGPDTPLTFSIWVTRRTAKSDEWGQPAKVDLAVPDGYLAGDPSLSTDGLELYFISANPTEAKSNLCVAKRQTKDAPWTESVNLGPAVNFESNQVGPRISADGRVLLSHDWWACSPRTGGLGSRDIWLSRRTTTSSEWEPPRNIGPPINTAYHDTGAVFSPDGSMLYFRSDRPGGSGWHDLWQAPILPVVDFDDDGSVGTSDLLVMIGSWGTDDRLCDIGPMAWGDGVVDKADLEVLMDYWGHEYPVEVESGVVIDDFENYTDNWDTYGTIFHTWLDGMGYGDPAPGYDGNGTGSVVGHASGPPFAEQTIVHGGYQSMPLWYDNDGTLFEGGEWEKTGLPFYSEAQRHWETPQDWTVKGVEVLTLWFHGDAGNAPGRQTPELLYVALEDAAGNSAVIMHPDPSAITTESWQQWSIALADFVGADPTAITVMAIGVGDPANTSPRGEGVVYIDDIELRRPSEQ